MVFPRSLLRSRIATNPGALRHFAEPVGPQDVVALESTTKALAVARLLRRRAGRALT
jgi:hypothetical protein